MTADHLQAFIDFLSYGGTNPDRTTSRPMSKGDMLLFSAVLQNSFRFAVFPKKLITFNPMQYVKLRGRKQETDIFSDSEEDTASIPTITHEQFKKLEEFLRAKDNPALLPVQIAYYTGLRIGEVCSLTWQDIRADKQRKGYAKEAARAVRDWTFNNTPFNVVYSYMKYTNMPSYKTAISWGCIQVNEFKDDVNEITKVFAISRDEWSNQ